MPDVPKQSLRSRMQGNTGETFGHSGVVFPGGLESGEQAEEGGAGHSVSEKLGHRVSEDAAGRKTSIRTLESDIADTVRKENLSVASIAIRQQEHTAARAAASDARQPAEKSGGLKRALVVALSVVLIAGGVGALWYSYGAFIKNNSVDEMPSPAAATAFIPATDTHTFDVTGLGRAALLALIEKERGDVALAPGSITALSFVKQQTATSSEKVAVSSTELFDTLQTTAPGRLVRSLENDFFAGLYVNAAGDAEPFLIFKTQSFETAFAGMLEWEGNLPSDLPFIRTSPKEDPTPVFASTTPATATPPIIQLPPIWKDIIVKNKDARGLVAGDNSVSPIYAFADKQTLVIAPSKELLAMLFEQLSTARFTQ